MGKMKSTKTSADKSKGLYKLLKGNIDNSYFLEVLYYHLRLALIKTDFNLSDVDAFNISGKYLGYDLLVDLDRKFNNVIRSLSLVLSLRAFMIDPDYFNYSYDDDLLFLSISRGFLSWDSHRVIMECLDDEDFSSIYEMIVRYDDESQLPEDLIAIFNENTIKPEYHNLEKFCKILAGRDDYHGRTVIKNNSYFNSDIDSFVVSDVIDYVGNTVFAYCENLKELRFEGKVLFGRFPIIECHNLRQIIVPTEYLNYYKEALPYYKDIIFDHEQEYESSENVIEPATDTVEANDNVDNKGMDDYGDLEIEHVYLDIPSADEYIEEVESKTEIDYSSLERVFDKKTTSYKYFWFLSIITLAKERQNLNISYNDILFRMASMAWPLIFDYEISLGDRDMISKYLYEIQITTGLPPTVSSLRLEKYLQQNYKFQGIKSILSPLLKNVPYRFLSPWYKFTSNDDVIAASNRRDFTGLYALKEEGIVLNKDWWDYINRHYKEICDMSIKSMKAYISGYNNDKAVVKLFVNGISFIG